MQYDLVRDYDLQKILWNAIKELPTHKQFSLRTLINCCHKTANPTTGVAILSNGKFSNMYGARMCKNSWVCPVCSAIQMSKAATKIAAAIDSLNESHFAIMLTFTVFHSKADTCEQVFDLLFDTWTRFTRNRFDDTYGNFLNDLEIKHYVRCAEVTYSKNGWHPHFHCLYFVPKKNYEKIIGWEMKLREIWRNRQEKAMKKIYGYVKYNAFYESETKHGEIAAGVYISKDENKKPIKMKSSDYVCGWGADKEITGNFQKKATDPNSKTPYQLLQDMKNDDETAKNLYLELANYIITHKRRRVDFDRHGIKQIISNYLQSQKYLEVMKKKHSKIMAEQAGKKWKVVIWFSKDDWLKICRKDFEVNYSLIFIMLCLGKYDDGYYLIKEFLEVNDVKTSALDFDPVGFYEQLATKLNAEIADSLQECAG